MPQIQPTPKDSKTLILENLQTVQQSLQQAYKLGVEKNPMCSAVPAFKRLEEIGKELISLQQEIAKLRGL